MIDSQKNYLCTSDEPLLAANLYDIVILQAKGLSSKTNFNYMRNDLLSILFEPSIIKAKQDIHQNIVSLHTKFFDDKAKKEMDQKEWIQKQMQQLSDSRAYQINQSSALQTELVTQKSYSLPVVPRYSNLNVSNILNQTQIS